MKNTQNYSNETNVCTFDLETTYGEHLGRIGNPFSDGSIGLCSAGFKLPTGYVDHYFVKDGPDGTRHGIQRGDPEWFDSFPDLSGVDVFVGHNFKFDLLWYWRHPRLEEFLRRGGVIWDTMYAEYLLSGQFFHLAQLPHLVPSLKNVARRRGCKLKLDVVAALWEQGVRTEDIQEHILLEYNKGDIETTEEIYYQQLEQAVRQNQLHMITERMDGLLATTEMEFNGLMIDLDEAETRLAELNIKADELAEILNTHVPELPESCVFNFNSTAHLSALIFGGSIKYRAPVVKTNEDGSLQYYKKKRKVRLRDAEGNFVRNKGGMNKGAIKTKMVSVDDIGRGPKTRLEDHWFKLPRQATPKKKWRGETEGQYSTAAAVLEEVGKQGIKLVDDLLALRGLEKDIGTYYKRFHRGKWTGMLTMVCEDGRIHHNLNHFITLTSRLSSSKPNLQNISGTNKSMVRKMFVSRFGDDGVMAEGDYSQLEVVCKGVLSEDWGLLKALIDGVCFHCDWLSLSPLAEGKSYEEVYRLCKVEHVPEWTAKRKLIKPLTFGEAYGAGVASLCESTGMSAEEVESAIAARKLKYPKMYQFDEDNIAKVKKSRQPSEVRTAAGMQAGIGYLRSATDTIYHFTEGDSPDWMQKRGIHTSFSPTTIKNYPSQGLGGEIMQSTNGRLFRWVLENDRFDDELLLVNTVHDCCWFDLKKSRQHHLSEAQAIMEDVCDHFNKTFPNVNWNTPFPVEFEVGPTLYDMEPLHI